MQGLDGIERQFGDLDDCGIAYAVGGDLWFHVLLAIGWWPCLRRYLGRLQVRGPTRDPLLKEYQPCQAWANR
jgi:hypothetical protein